MWESPTWEPKSPVYRIHDEISCMKKQSGMLVKQLTKTSSHWGKQKLKKNQKDLIDADSKMVSLMVDLK